MSLYEYRCPGERPRNGLSGLAPARKVQVLGCKPSLRGVPLPPHPLVFTVGNMFLTRPEVVRKMVSYFGEAYPYPNEPIADDGTVFHLIERLWPTASADCGLASVFINKPDQPRR